MHLSFRISRMAKDKVLPFNHTEQHNEENFFVKFFKGIQRFYNINCINIELLKHIFHILYKCDVCIMHKSLWLVRYILLPHEPVSGGSKVSAGGGLQQEGGGDEGDCDGEERRDWGSGPPLGWLWTTARDTRCPGGLCPLAHRECLPTSQPLVWVHASVWSLLDGWVVLLYTQKSIDKSDYSKSLYC